MRIKRLHIGDFGILQNQTLEDLNPGLVIVGGHNRAGKSTFMQVLRFLGYGISSGGSTPPANVEYMVDADVWNEEADKNFHIRLQGHSEPVCTLAGEGNRVSVSELYPIDAFTYKNLYTISLDQLVRQPEGISDKEMDKLQSALLGAGLVDIANIPRLKDIFTNNAKNIGGATGRLSNKAFRTQIDIIRKGTTIKNNALAQVDEYHRQQNHLSQLKDNKQALDKQLEQMQARRDILGTVLDNYDVFEEVIDLDGSLEHHEGTGVPDSLNVENRDRVEAAYENYRSHKEKKQELLGELVSRLGNQERAAEIQTLLLRYRTVLQSFIDRLSGLQEKWNNLSRMRERLKQDKRQITARIQGLNADWVEDGINKIRQLQLELLEERRLMDESALIQEIDNKLEQAKFRLDETNNRKEEIKTEIEEYEKHAPVPGLKLYLWAFVVSAALGIAFSFLHPTIGLFLGVFGIIGSALFVFFKGLGHKETSLRLKEQRSKLKGIQATYDKLQQEIDDLAAQRQEIESYLSDVCDKLGLHQVISPKSILEYYRAVADIRQRIVEMDEEEKDINDQSFELAGQMKEMDRVISELENVSGVHEGNHLTSHRDVMQEEIWQDIQARLKRWYDLMNTAVQLDNLSQEMIRVSNQMLSFMGQEVTILMDTPENSLEEHVEKYLSQCKAYSDYQDMKNKLENHLQSLERVAASDRIKKAFSLLESNEGQQDEGDTSVYHLSASDASPLLQQLFGIYHRYSVRDSIERENYALKAEIDNQIKEVESCSEDIQKTKLLLGQLSLTKELEQAHEMIQEGRSGLFQVSYDYAVQKTAAWLCGEIRNEFMTRMKDELLLKADGILSQLTGEDYQRIIPNDDLTDFSFELKDGSKQANSHILSRGTREQVFLAVRLGRILEMKPALPVIIDDSLVNFDCAHLQHAVEVIGRLSQTHQVFVMTCHPHLVEHFTQISSEISSSIQYWRLDKGRFFPSEGWELMEYLS